MFNGGPRIALALVAAGALAACSSGDGDPQAKVTETVTVTASPSAVITATPEPTPTEEADPYAPNLGDRALTIGDTREGQDFSTTLKSVKYPYPPDYAREPDKGNTFVGLELEQCMHDDAEVDPDIPAESTYNGEWTVLDPEGYEFGGDGSSWNDWPSPKFPELVSMNPGRCLKGWISLQVPTGTKISSIIWRPQQVETAEWLPKG